MIQDDFLFELCQSRKPGQPEVGKKRKKIMDLYQPTFGQTDEPSFLQRQPLKES